jgi:Cu2+-containing amine oxidase
MTSVPQSPPAVAHPLEPLTADEVARAVRILRSERQLGDAMRFVIVTLHEPAGKCPTKGAELALKHEYLSSNMSTDIYLSE